MAKKAKAKQEIERIELDGKTLVKFDDGTAQLILDLSTEEVEALFASEETAEESDDDDDDDEDEEEEEPAPKKRGRKAKVEEPEEEEEDEEDDEESDDEDGEDEVTGESLAEMDFEELEDLCDDQDLNTDPDDFDEDDVEKLRKAVAKELGITLPGKGKKGKK